MRKCNGIREPEAERGAAPERALHFQAGAMELHDALRDRQAEPGVRIPSMRVSGPVEVVEDAGKMLGGDARSTVGDRHPHRVPIGCDQDPDRSAVRRMRERVVDQVLEHALDEGDVRLDHRQPLAGVDVDGRATVLRLQLELLRDVADELGQRDRLAFGGLLARIELRKLEQVPDEAAQPLALAEGHREIVLPLGPAKLRVLELQRLDVAMQRRERGAQIVGDVRHHLPAQRVRLLQGLELLADPGRHLVVRASELGDLVAVVRARGRERLEVSKSSRPESIDVVGEPAQSAGHCAQNHESGQRPHHDAHDQGESAVARKEARVQQRRDGIDTLSQEHHVEVAFRILLARHRGDRERLLPAVTARIVTEQGVGVVAAQERPHRPQRHALALDHPWIGRKGKNVSFHIK